MGIRAREPALRGATVRVDIRRPRPEADAPPRDQRGVLELDRVRRASTSCARPCSDALEAPASSRQQRQALRRQILDQLLAETPFDLPADLVAREEASTIRRLVMELRQEGIDGRRDPRPRGRDPRQCPRVDPPVAQGVLPPGQDRRGRGDQGRRGGLRGGDRGDRRADRREPPPGPLPAREGRAGRRSSTTQILERKVIDRILESSTVEDDVTAAAEPEGASRPWTTAAAEAEAPASRRSRGRPPTWRARDRRRIVKSAPETRDAAVRSSPGAGSSNGLGECHRAAVPVRSSARAPPLDPAGPMAGPDPIRSDPDRRGRRDPVPSAGP